MQVQFARPLAVGEIEADRSGRAPPAHPEPVADGRVEAADGIGRVAGVDESGNAPARIEPMRGFDADDAEVTASDNRRAFLDSQALVRITAYRAGAAGAEQIVLRDAFA